MLIATTGDLSLSSDLALLELVASEEWEGIRTALLAGTANGNRGSKVAPDTLRTAEIRFRREHRLLAAEDLRSWLQARQITIPQWRDHLQRGLLGMSDETDATPGARHVTDPVSNVVLAAHAHTALILDGWYSLALHRILQGVAAVDLGYGNDLAPDRSAGDGDTAYSDAGALATRAAGDPLLPLENRDITELTELSTLVLTLRSALTGAHLNADERRIREVFAERRLDWTSLQFDEISLTTESAAKEAVLCIRDDRLDLRTVAERAGTQPTSTSCTAAEAGPGVGPLLLAATVGQALGPITDGALWRVLVLRARTVPDLEVAGFHDRARDEVVADQLNRHLAGKVEFHADL